MDNKIHYSREEYRTEYLSSDEWIAKSKYILNRDKICRICNKEKSHDTHHLTYKNIPFENLNGDLIGVCRKCHNKIHHWSFLEVIQSIEKIRYYLFDAPKHIFLNEKFCLSLNGLNINAKKRINSILKKNIWDFTELVGVKISFRKFCEIKKLYFILKDKNAPNKNERWLRGKRSYITLGRYKNF